MSNNIAIMYHYVSDDGRFRAFSTEQFRNQVRFLSENYEMVTLSEYLSRSRPTNTCMLTFDDGMKDGIKNAAPIMEEFGARGVFFVSTCTLVRRKLVAAQKRSLLLMKLGVDQFIDTYNQLVPEYYRITEGKALDEYNDPKSSLLKHLLDNMEPDLSEKILGELFDAHFCEEEAFDGLYLNKKDILDLKNRGHDVGSHGHDHRWLGKLYPQDQMADLKASVNVFRSEIGDHPRFMSYPFGSRNEITLRLLPSLGFQAAMLDPTSAVVKENAFEMNRFDCIDVIPGRPLPDPLMRKTVPVYG